ncbi:hypothetical protein N7532_008169 [Penicillium argentinense]|uniref:Cell wall galactomannoprotein n=1 Tax=Penicillium argentinense TaxID=1131581 RepID=A0A9W9EX58_9EURO|nr:uncharacterized protein N7532_008169 [Penicillium argentinense]KAJ5089485.1 hypothetical protein N7532_008169 [Penicillium argentinense]
MQFKLSTIVGLLAVASPALAVDAVSRIDGFTVLAKDVQTTANSIELTNALSKASDTIDRFYKLHNAERLAKNDLARKGEALAADQQQAACNSFTNYASAATDMLNTVKEKQVDVELVGKGYQMAAHLRALEGVNDDFADLLTELLAPSCGSSLADTIKDLDKLLTSTKKAYTYGLP